MGLLGLNEEEARKWFSDLDNKIVTFDENRGKQISLLNKNILYLDKKDSFLSQEVNILNEELTNIRREVIKNLKEIKNLREINFNLVEILKDVLGEKGLVKPKKPETTIDKLEKLERDVISENLDDSEDVAFCFSCKKKRKMKNIEESNVDVEGEPHLVLKGECVHCGTRMSKKKDD